MSDSVYKPFISIEVHGQKHQDDFSALTLPDTLSFQHMIYSDKG